jgi:putative peptidoglycan lipid II flippase
VASSRSRRLAGAAAIVMGAYIASRFSGLLRDIAVSYRFGTGRELDAYLAANRIPDLIFQIAAGAAVASAFIPVYSTYLSKGDRQEQWKLVSILFTISVVGLLPIVLVVMVAAPWLMQLLVPNYPPEYQALAASLSRIVLLAPVFFTVGCFATSLLNAHGRFLLAALAPTSYNLGIILGAVVYSRWLGIYGLALGALTGSLLFFLVQLPGLWQVGLVYRPRLDLRDPGVRRIAKLMAPRAIGLAVSQVNFVVTLNLASGIAGGVAALNYAWILTMLPLGIVAMAISTAVFPTLADHGARDDESELQRTLRDALRFILFLTIPASVGLIVLSPQVVRLIYQRGQFTPESTAVTAAALRFYAAGLVGMAATEIVTRAFYALHDTRTPVKVAAVGMIVNLGLAIVLVRLMGLNGLALATAVAATVEATILFAVGQSRIPGLAFRTVADSALKSLVSAGLMAAVVLVFVRTATPLSETLSGLVLLGGAVVVGSSAYLVSTIVLRSPETGQLRRLLQR